MSVYNQLLVIDDDPDYCQLIKEVLAPDFDCVLAHTGKDGLAQFTKHCDPVLVIVDLNLPDMSGFEVCETLSEFKDERSFALFVISGDDTVNSRLRTFESGADDFIAKPFEMAELKSKISRVIDYVKKQIHLKQEGDETRKMANIAMAQASQYSYVMNFFKSLNHCQTPEHIASLFYEAMAFFELASTIKIRFKGVHYFDKNMGDISPIETSIYELLKDQGRIHEFGKRILINGRNVAFLIKNFPDDEHAAGQARDFLAALVEGIESKIDELEVKATIVEATVDLGQAINTINQNLTTHNIAINEVMGDMITDISSSYHRLALTDEQETYFTNMVETGSEKMHKAEGTLKGVQAQLQDILSKMESIEAISTHQNNQGGSATDTVDLF